MKRRSDAQTVCAEVVQPDENIKMVSHILDVFDGTNVIQVVGEGLNTPTKGTLRRDVKGKLSFSAASPVRPMFLFAAPITQIFTPENTTISEGPDNTIILECLLPYKYPMLGRMTVSKQHWRPTDLVTSNPGSKRVHTHFVLDNYHEYAEGIWFPSHILEMNISEAGSKTSDSEYRLVKLHLNTQVDTAPLHPLCLRARTSPTFASATIRASGLPALYIGNIFSLWLDKPDVFTHTVRY